MRKLIADSGSTKTDWILLQDGVEMLSFQSSGLNPYVHSLSEIENILSEVYAQFENTSFPESIYFYGAGCSSSSLRSKMENGFKNAGFESKTIHVSHDLLAAAHALFQNNDGISCILGTGSSSALYSDGSIIDNLPALGYVLGDEGGGVDLGKRLLISIYKREAPINIRLQFEKEFNLDVEKVLQNIYFEKSPNRFIASFTKFILENMEEKFLEDIVLKSFRSFVELNVLKYQNVESLPIGFVGSVAYHFKKWLIQVLNEYKLSAGPFLKRPIEGLVKYHADILP